MVATAFSICATELIVLSIWNTFGANAFSESNIFLVGAVISLFVALPTTYFMGCIIYQLSINQADLRRLAETDELTGLSNRRSFFQRAKDQLTTSRELGKPIALLVIDADHFKQHDTYGHATGDAVLYAAKAAGRNQTILYGTDQFFANEPVRT